MSSSPGTAWLPIYTANVLEEWRSLNLVFTSNWTLPLCNWGPSVHRLGVVWKYWIRKRNINTLLRDSIRVSSCTALLLLLLLLLLLFILTIERGSTRSHAAKNSFCKRLWTCRKTQQNEWMHQSISFQLCTSNIPLFLYIYIYCNSHSVVAIYSTCNVVFYSKVLCFCISTLVVLLLLLLLLLYCSVQGKWRPVVNAVMNFLVP